MINRTISRHARNRAITKISEKYGDIKQGKRS